LTLKKLGLAKNIKIAKLKPALSNASDGYRFEGEMIKQAA
jgi:hypothetical protein